MNTWHGIEITPIKVGDIVKSGGKRNKGVKAEWKRIKRNEAEARNRLTPIERTRAFREGSVQTRVHRKEAGRIRYNHV